MSRPLTLFTAASQLTLGTSTSCPKTLTQVYICDRKIWKLFSHVETGEIRQNVINSSVQHPISLIFAIHVSFIIPLPMVWILLTKLRLMEVDSQFPVTLLRLETNTDQIIHYFE